MEIELKSLKVINETLVEKILDQFEKLDFKDLYNKQEDFFKILDTLCSKHRILLREVDSDTNKISGGYRETPELDNYDYEIILYVPRGKELIEQDIRDYINSILHEFTHIMILKGMTSLYPLKNKNSIIAKFKNSITPHRFDINQITKENSIKFLNYIFDMTERPVFAFSIAYSCYFYRHKEGAQKLFNLNKTYILDYERKTITPQHMNNYIANLRDEKLFLFQIQYSVYFLSDRKYILKLDSFMNLIKKYEKRFLHSLGG